MSFRSHRLARKAIAAVPATCLPCCVLTAAEEELVPARAVDFERDVRPIFATHCVSCHGEAAPGERAFGSTAATTPCGRRQWRGHRAGQEWRKPARRTYRQRPIADPRMPPKGDPLATAAVDRFAAWIDQGAAWPADAEPAGRRADRPLVATSRWCARRCPRAGRAAHAIRSTPSSCRQLADNGLQPSPEADRRTLIRRVTFDLIGLPPTPEEVDAFVADTAPDAYEQLVDRLLASPRYGERWARHWMDVVHFAETHGHDQDRPRPNAWPYRDYLIRSFNDDKPYARFVAEQVAGDVLYPDDPQAIVALGFLAAGPWDESSLMCIVDDTVDKKLGADPRSRRHGHHRHVDLRQHDGPLRPLPQPQVRSDLAGRLLRPAGRLRRRRPRRSAVRSRSGGRSAAGRNCARAQAALAAGLAAERLAADPALQAEVGRAGRRVAPAPRRLAGRSTPSASSRPAARRRRRSPTARSCSAARAPTRTPTRSRSTPI